MKIEFAINLDRGGASSWSAILHRLKIESGLELYDKSFEEWLLKEWNIKLLHDHSMFTSHLTGVEMDEETLTMLVLKFPKAFSGQG